MALPIKQQAEIKRKAEANIPLANPTPQSQQAYQQAQDYFTSQVQQKAQAGQALDNPNAWKNSLYQQFAGSGSAPAPNGLMSIQDYMNKAQANSQTQMQALQQFLQNSANAQITGQQAQLGMAKDQALAQLEANLQKAINQGQLSIKEAEAQFASAKKQIDEQAYRDSEITNLTAHDRGIQNSAQMLGLMQGDQYRQQSLISDAMTTRDQQINAINNQLEQMKYETGVNKSLAQSQYDYGLAGASADILAKMYAQMGEMGYGEMQRLADREYGLQQMQFQQGFDLQKLSQQQLYQMQQMAQQQNYNTVNMEREQKYALDKMSVQQKYQLEQMAQAFGYDLQKMSVDQQYRLAQMAQSFGYDFALQSNSQQFQAQQQERGFAHDLTMLQEKFNLDTKSYEQELQRQLRYYTNMDTSNMTENDLRQFQQADAETQAIKQNAINLSNAIKNQQLASLIEAYPKMPGASATKKDWDAYLKQVDTLNGQIEKITGSKEFTYQIDKSVASGAITKEQGNSLANSLKTLATSIPTIGNIMRGAWNSAKAYASP